MAKIPFKIRNAIMNYIEEINKICKVEKVILFGSYVSGHYSSMSDIDIAIFSKEINNNNRIEFIKKFFMKINKYRLDIQPIAFGLNDLMDEENDFIITEIKNKGIEIYSRD